LEAEKHHFILILSPHVNKCIFQAQYSLKSELNRRKPTVMGDILFFNVHNRDTQTAFCTDKRKIIAGRNKGQILAPFPRTSFEIITPLSPLNTSPAQENSDTNPTPKPDQPTNERKHQKMQKSHIYMYGVVANLSTHRIKFQKNYTHLNQWLIECYSYHAASFYIKGGMRHKYQQRWYVTGKKWDHLSLIADC
jgi:hypothetical protein